MDYLVADRPRGMNGMMTFACKKINKKELIRCSFDLNRTEYNVLIFMLECKSMCGVSQVAKSMGLERTTVQKAIKTLLNKRLAKRMQKNLPRGGYIFYYKINKKCEIKDKMRDIVNEWYKGVEKEINRL